MSPSMLRSTIIVDAVTMLGAIRSGVRVGARRCAVSQAHATPVRPVRLSSTAAAPPPPPPTPKRGPWRPIGTAILLGLFGAGTYVLGSLYPPEAILLVYPRPAEPLPPLEDAEKVSAHAAKIERQLLALPHIKALLASVSPIAVQGEPSATGTDAAKAHYVLSRPFNSFPEHERVSNLTAGSLRQPGMLAVAPVVLSKTQHGADTLGGYRGDAFAFVHLGSNLCGHKGIVHGGLLATVLDETLARTAFFQLPHHVGVTARLEIDYKQPVRANNVIVVETKLIEHEGRKAWVEATMRDLRGRVLVQSRALFVEPKMAKWLDTSAVGKLMDHRDE